MVFGSDVGIVLRARRGRNILVQAHGLDVKTVSQAANEAAAVLEGDPPSSSVELLDMGVGAQLALACGHLHVLGNRFAVVYRLVHKVLVIVVSRSHANVFSNLNLAAGISRLLVAEVKSIDLTADRLLKKYAQVYLSIDALINRGSLDLIGALLDANAQLESLSPDAVKARKARQAAERAAAAAAAAAASGSRQLRQIGRRVPEPHHDHGRFSFLAPPELTSLQVNAPVYQLPDLPEPDRPLPAPKLPEGLPLQGQEAKAKEDDKQQEGDQWTAFDQEQQQQPEPAKSSLLQFQGPPLVLQEAWQVEVVGSRVARAGLVGAVRWAAPEAKALAGSTPFRVQAPVEQPDPRLLAALKCAWASTRGTKHGQLLGAFLADTLSPLPAGAPLLQYCLPASFGVLPLMAHMSCGAVEHRGRGGPGVALLALRYHVPHEFKLPPQDLAVDLHVPPGFAAPRRIEPPGASWSASQSLLRWQLGAVAPGGAGCLLAAFRVKDGAEAAAAGLGRCYAMLRLRGQGTITGVQLAQSRTTTAAAAVEPGTASWVACVLARPCVGEAA